MQSVSSQNDGILLKSLITTSALMTWCSKLP